MKHFYKRMGRAMTVPAGLAIGIGLAVLFVVNRQTPTHDDSASVVPSLAVIEVQPLAFRLEARGYGAARPAETWQAVANVPGRVVERHPDLESGTLLREGTLLLALDPSRYRLAIAEAEAELAGLVAEKDQVEAEAENIRRLLKLERDRLGLAEQELSRIESLAESGTVSSSKRDEQIRATLAQRQAVFLLDNQLRVLPSRRERLEAQVERASTRLEQARRDLEDTRFVAPYDLRLREVDVEMHQHVGAGQRIFQADSIEAAEVEAHIPISMILRLMGGVALLQPGPDALDLAERLDFSAIRAEVVLVGAEGVHWPARVSRVASGLDPRTRTVRVVVTVDEPYRDARPPDRPPLQRDMYVRVHLSTDSPEPLLAVPAAAVHRGEVYRVDKDDRLELRPVRTAFEQNDLAVIREGLAPGDRVIVDDPVPALHGMSVKPIRDRELERRLQRSAAGDVP
ncbi:MAG: efflux RND transporter periplasmic adaptor subunit [Deltaproteobacteria bacterium]|nr:efflux RND transporter periplasmic adaptor subunit [Deltaproteobacteria bacterium]